MMSTSMRWGVAVLAGLMLPVLAAGQESERVVSAQGTASVEKMPEIVRLKIDIPAVGSDVKEALAKLKAKREGAVKKLKELGAADGAIRVDGPRLAPDPTEMMRRQRVMMRGRIPQEEESEEEKRPSKVNVALTLHAEWPVKTEDSESLLVFAHELQEKVKKADLAALKEEKLTEEEEEELAQMAEDMPRFDSDEVPPGEAVIVYVARIGDEERAKLLADAFANAKADAGRMAAAAGVQLGDLASLSSHTTGPDENFSRYSYAYGSRFYQVMQQARAMMSPESEDREAVGIEPKKITHRVVMMASFRLK